MFWKAVQANHITRKTHHSVEGLHQKVLAVNGISKPTDIIETAIAFQPFQILNRTTHKSKYLPVFPSFSALCSSRRKHTAISFSSSANPQQARFSLSLSKLELLGMTQMSRWVAKRRSTWAVVLECFLAMASTKGSVIRAKSVSKSQQGRTHIHKQGHKLANNSADRIFKNDNKIAYGREAAGLSSDPR